MRETKFRAWDEINNKWVDECDLIMESSGRVWAGDINNPPMIQIESKNVVFFTGLKDKSGKDIYEGDILAINNTRYVVGYRGYSGGWQLEINNEYCAEMVQGNCELLEFVGNIYENLELLEASGNDNNSDN